MEEFHLCFHKSSKLFLGHPIYCTFNQFYLDKSYHQHQEDEKWKLVDVYFGQFDEVLGPVDEDLAPVDDGFGLVGEVLGQVDEVRKGLVD